MNPRRSPLTSLLPVLLAFACGEPSGGHDSGSTGSEESSGGADDAGAPGDASSHTQGHTTDPGSDTTGDAASDDGATDTSVTPECTPGPVPCEDALVLDLSLVAAVSQGVVTNTADGDGWRTEVDARAGGLPGLSTNPWVYLRFEQQGAVRVEIDDFEALESEEWHIAAKRYALRLNGGSGGPSCVAAAALVDQSYEAIDARGDAVAELESFYDDSCTLQDDGMGLGAPGYTLTPWWTYPGCVATTAVPFVIDLPDGGAIKLVVDSYYGSGQANCNDTGTMGSDAGRFVWRWAQLP